MLAALARLTEDDRELLTLMAWQNLSSREAAWVIGCSTATFFVRLHRARRPHVVRTVRGAAACRAPDGSTVQRALSRRC
nr:sigma-70 region 4 domain-containing protein [Micromonospora sp. U21]